MAVFLILEVSRQVQIDSRCFVNPDRELGSPVESLEGERLVNLVQTVDGLAGDSERSNGLLKIVILRHDYADKLVVLEEIIGVHFNLVLVNHQIGSNLKEELVGRYVNLSS